MGGWVLQVSQHFLTTWFPHRFGAAFTQESCFTRLLFTAQPSIISGGDWAQVIARYRSANNYQMGTILVEMEKYNMRGRHLVMNSDARAGSWDQKS